MASCLPVQQSKAGRHGSGLCLVTHLDARNWTCEINTPKQQQTPWLYQGEVFKNECVIQSKCSGCCMKMRISWITDNAPNTFWTVCFGSRLCLIDFGDEGGCSSLGYTNTHYSIFVVFDRVLYKAAHSQLKAALLFL